ncbi:FAD-dependent monooxygenase [Nonomuraea sp. WAC 01424]|uniref:FAD-dependent monooxygenase n=1 Tax=Nonomuraea sp. WAC 01424 TaxID=2203200 RepID=UPI0021AD91C6|nr:FAD-dependent monooxygenase [Nonomuraea sp. WAC 01424]
MAEIDLELLTARFGSAPRVIPRGSLISLLAGGLPEGAVRFGAQVEDLEADRDGVRVRTRAGTEYEADFLIGADGVRSRVRALVLGDGPAATTGAAIWQGLDAYSARRRRRAALASTVASNMIAVSGPRSPMQSEPLMRLNGTAPPRLATLGFARLLRALSDRI